VAVIPAYGLRLLEGCGSIKRGELRVIGKTGPVPFITVFLADNIAPEKEQKILKLLLGLKNDAKLLKAMESRNGFQPVKTPPPGAPQANAGPDWPDWRGPNRDGLVPRLPTRLPETAKLVWKKAAMTGGLAGLSVSNGRLILAERDFAEEYDVYRCLHADTGELLWRIEFPAAGKLDYGQSPRAAPVFHNGQAYLLGAFGELRCVNVTNGTVLWKRHLLREFQATLPIWGMSATPLIVDDLLIVNPGGTNASLAALDCHTGATRWTTPGAPAAYAAFICGEFGGRRQLVGYDQFSLGGWDVKTGARLWKLVPATEGDFNVPTPIAVKGGVLVATENNGTRFYRFDADGRIIPTPAGEYQDLSPDTATPIATRDRVFGAHLGLHCLDAQNGFKRIWHHDDDTVGYYATLLADAERVLVITVSGELILLDAGTDECVIISRLRVFDDDVEVYSHPALVGTRLYVRGGNSVRCVDLAPN
jgi:outer membrane protein assembly factor BamB